jgi:quinol monooxygenase YgiN
VKGVTEMIAEVHRSVGGSTADANSENTKRIGDEAVQAPGTEGFLVLRDSDAGETLVIHLWTDQAAYEANAERRDRLTAEAESAGVKIEPGQFYEVVYRL